jgi:Calcineurin-like phosphoesterase
MTAKDTISAFERATQANREDRCRTGNLIRLKGPGEVIMTGDLHGNNRNFDKLVRFASLADNPQRHLILHELLHGDIADCGALCHSYRLIARAAELKAQYPHRVHYLLGNHAIAQFTNDEVLKGGMAMVRALNAGLLTTFGSSARLVTSAMNQFILSLPIAARTDNRIWMSHSLPSMRKLAGFQKDIFDKELTGEELHSNPSLRALIWDRVHSPECLKKLGEMWDVDMFIVGHQPQAQGCAQPCSQMIILASDHIHGCFLPFDLGKSYEPDELFAQAKPLASIE